MKIAVLGTGMVGNAIGSKLVALALRNPLPILEMLRLEFADHRPPGKQLGYV